MCPSTLLVFDPYGGEHLCGRCGIVLESHTIDSSMHDAVSPNRGREDWGVGTMLPGDAGVIPMAARRDPRGARLNRVLTVLRRMAESIQAGQTISQEAYSICRHLAASGHIARRDKTALSAAILMLACRMRGRALKWQEIPGLDDKRRRAMKVYRHLQYTVPSPQHYTRTLISRLCADLNLPICRARRAVDILERMQQAGFTAGRKPQCVAAATIALTGSKPSKRDITHAAGVSAPGLRNLLMAWDKTE